MTESLLGEVTGFRFVIFLQRDFIADRFLEHMNFFLGFLGYSFLNLEIFPENEYLFQVNNKETRKSLMDVAQVSSLLNLTSVLLK